MSDTKNSGSYRWAPPYECPVCGKQIEHFIEVLGIRGNCPHCYGRVSHRV